MTAANTLNATERTQIGKASHKLAQSDQIPAVLYGPKQDPVPLAVSRRAFELFAARRALGSTIIDLVIEGKKKPIPAMVRDVQYAAVKNTILHVDFLAISMDKSVSTVVPLRLVNDPIGVKAGGVLTVIMRELSIEAKPTDLPEAIAVDVSALEIGDSLTVSDVVAPKGVSIMGDPEAVVVSVQAPRFEAEDEVEGEEAEPELVGKEEGEEA
ncbi:MAG: 50S ribosomal protein L25 [Coriobacteriia bacterium]|nr:50S ribosomal protein L25 [Coriobacteriia bacterium]